MNDKETIKKIEELITTIRRDKDNINLLSDNLIEIAGYLYPLGEHYGNVRIEWSRQFLKAKQEKNPISKKTYTDKEAECRANEIVPDKERLKIMLDIVLEFIKNTKVKIAILNKEKEYESKL